MSVEEAEAKTMVRKKEGVLVEGEAKMRKYW